MVVSAPVSLVWSTVRTTAKAIAAISTGMTAASR